jgi:hypothetical protein
MSHYLSTACYHEHLASDPALHDACRLACKFCDAPCSCPQHPQESGSPRAVSGIDQARDIARELLSLLEEAGGVPYKLHERLSDDPRLFWLSGGEAPPGTWKQGEEQR